MRAVDAWCFLDLRSWLTFDGKRERSETLSAGEHHEGLAVVIPAISRDPYRSGLCRMACWRFEYLVDEFQQFGGARSTFGIETIRDHPRRHVTSVIGAAGGDDFYLRVATANDGQQFEAGHLRHIEI